MTKISFDVTNRWTGAVQFTAEIERIVSEIGKEG